MAPVEHKDSDVQWTKCLDTDQWPHLHSFQTIFKNTLWLSIMAHTDIISFSPYLQSSSVLLTGRAVGLSRHKQLQVLKGKFHRLSGPIDFHLSMHRAKVCVDINRITGWHRFTPCCTCSSKCASLLLMKGFSAAFKSLILCNKNITSTAMNSSVCIRGLSRIPVWGLWSFSVIYRQIFQASMGDESINHMP